MNGKALMAGIDLKGLDASDFIDVLTHMFVEEQLFEKEYQDVRGKARAQILRAFQGSNFDSVEYNSTETYGGPNDNDLSPLPALTEQTEEGYIGLDPPLN